MRFVLLSLIVLGVALPSGAFGEENPVRLYNGLGSWSHPIATSNPEAQKFFDQGLTLVYGFNRYEALRSFRKAAELDPSAAMAYWGMALAHGPYINMDGDPSFDLKGACAAVDAGLKITGAPLREKAYLQAVATWCPEYHPKAYSDAMSQLVKQYPDDLDALTLYADSLLTPVRWHWYTNDGVAAEGVLEAEHSLEEVLRRWPQHPGANHLYIHAVESSRSPERAIASAQRLMGITPAAGHMVHMPAHIWLIFGDWELAASLNDRAAAVDREYFAAANIAGNSYSPYYFHNLHFILYARAMQGRKADSLRAADELTAAAAPMAKAMPEMTDIFVAAPILAFVRFKDWDRVLATPKPADAMTTSLTSWHYSRALALVSKGDIQAAQQERDALMTLRESLPADAAWGQSKARDVSQIPAEILAARMAASPQEALPHWLLAVEAQDRLTYDEPPDWYYPVRESLGAALLSAGKPAEAEVVFREGVRRSPRNGRLLFGLMESLSAQGKAEEAQWVKREYDAAWAKADVVLRVSDL
jgi:tetratricopeptide (TPR) repeat protein